MAYSDRELLARLIQCEAGGEGDTGMKAVAGVVMNRVNARGGEYARVGQGSIRNIILQPYQFVCASETENGAYNPQNIYNMRPEQIHFDIADWAIAGNRIPDVAEYIRFVQDNIQRMSGQPCPLDGGSTEKRALSLIDHLAALYALEVMEA